MARKSVLFTALGVGSAAVVWAARRVERMLANVPVRVAAGMDILPEPEVPGVPVPQDAVSTVTTGDPNANLPARTWVVDNGTEWDGSPGEMVILPRPEPEANREGT